jgi:hypothetical protein
VIAAERVIVDHDYGTSIAWRCPVCKKAHRWEASTLYAYRRECDHCLTLLLIGDTPESFPRPRATS